MLEWLKFFGLSFFSDKIAKEARVRGVLNCVLGFVLALVFIYCGVLAANTVPFYTHYGNSAKFKSVVSTVLDKTQPSVDKKIIRTDTRIDTFVSQADADEFGKNGYNVVVDTRPSTAYDDFIAYCANKDGNEISYEDYLALTKDEQKGYEFKIKYTPNELTLTDEHITKFEEYLGGCDSEDVQKDYKAIADKKGTLSPSDYNGKLYTLYVKTYYPDISKIEAAGDVPMLRSYYYKNYLNKNDIRKSLFIFSDVALGFFDTDGGLSVNFYGYYNDLPSGKLDSKSADLFVKSVFSSSLSVSANVYLMNTVKFIPIIAFVPVILALIVKLVMMKLKDNKYKKYTVCLKMQFSYFTFAALFTAIILFVCSFFVSNATVNILPLIIFALIMTARTAVYVVTQTLAAKNQTKAPDGGTPQEQAEQIELPEQTERSAISAEQE